MSSEDTNTINKEKLDVYLRELAKEYRRMGGKAMPAGETFMEIGTKFRLCRFPLLVIQC